MSWYMFKDAPAFQSRGKKVDGFTYQPKVKINLAWGINQVLDHRPQSNSSSINQNNPLPDTVPATLSSNEPQPAANAKILTETSDDEQQQLLKLIKSQKAKDLQHDVIEMFNKRNKAGPVNTARSISNPINLKEQKNNSKPKQIDKRIRYLENSLLPTCRRDSMATIFDHDLNKGVPLEESRMSGKSVLHNKKNDSTVPMGDGYNYFIQPQQKPKELLDRLRDQYEYQELCKRRMERSNVRFG